MQAQGSAVAAEALQGMKQRFRACRMGQRRGDGARLAGPEAYLIAQDGRIAKVAGQVFSAAQRGRRHAPEPLEHARTHGGAHGGKRVHAKQARHALQTGILCEYASLHTAQRRQLGSRRLIAGAEDAGVQQRQRALHPVLVAQLNHACADSGLAVGEAGHAAVHAIAAALIHRFPGRMGYAHRHVMAHRLPGERPDQPVCVVTKEEVFLSARESRCRWASGSDGPNGCCPHR